MGPLAFGGAGEASNYIERTLFLEQLESAGKASSQERTELQQLLLLQGRPQKLVDVQSLSDQDPHRLWLRMRASLVSHGEERKRGLELQRQWSRLNVEPQP